MEGRLRNVQIGLLDDDDELTVDVSLLSHEVREGCAALEAVDGLRRQLRTYALTGKGFARPTRVEAALLSGALSDCHTLLLAALVKATDLLAEATGAQQVLPA